MKHILFWMVALLIACLVVLAAVPVLAQTDGDYDLNWWTVDGGGATFSTGGDYSIGGTIGQHDANVLEGGSYTLAGGFWAGGVSILPEYPLYLPVVMR